MGEGRLLEQIVDLADQRQLVNFDVLRRAPRASLQAVLKRYAPAPTRSELECFLRLCDDHGIPRPETNARIVGYEVDFVWRAGRLIVEVDADACQHRARRVGRRLDRLAWRRP